MQDIYPTYTCHPSTDKGTQANLQVPAVKGAAPEATVKATRDGDSIAASVDAQGGLAPYTFRWSSSSTTIDDNAGTEIAYTRNQRGKDEGETVTLEVTDANGISSHRIGGAARATAASRSPRTRAAAASASSPSARPTSASSRPSTSGSARRTARSASRP